MKKTDIIIIIIILMAAGILALIYLRNAGGGEYVVVRSDGEQVLRLPLDADPQQYEIDCGNGYNIIMVGGGEAWVQEADCPDKLCIDQGVIRTAGATVVCLPHRMVMSIEGDNTGIDSISE